MLGGLVTKMIGLVVGIPGHLNILLIEEILHHLRCVKPVNNGINYLSTGAGFLPSTLFHVILAEIGGRPHLSQYPVLVGFVCLVGDESYGFYHCDPMRFINMRFTTIWDNLCLELVPVASDRSKSRDW